MAGGVADIEIVRARGRNGILPGKRRGGVHDGPLLGAHRALCRRRGEGIGGDAVSGVGGRAADRPVGASRPGRIGGDHRIIIVQRGGADRYGHGARVAVRHADRCGLDGARASRVGHGDGRVGGGPGGKGEAGFDGGRRGERIVRGIPRDQAGRRGGGNRRDASVRSLDRDAHDPGSRAGRRSGGRGVAGRIADLRGDCEGIAAGAAGQHFRGEIAGQGRGARDIRAAGLDPVFVQLYRIAGDDAVRQSRPGRLGRDRLPGCRAAAGPGKPRDGRRSGLDDPDAMRCVRNAAGVAVAVHIGGGQVIVAGDGRRACAPGDPGRLVVDGAAARHIGKRVARRPAFGDGKRGRISVCELEGGGKAARSQRRADAVDQDVDGRLSLRVRGERSALENKAYRKKQRKRSLHGKRPFFVFLHDVIPSLFMARSA